MNIRKLRILMLVATSPQGSLSATDIPCGRPCRWPRHSARFVYMTTGTVHWLG